MDDLASRKQELYRAYDEAALRILMDRYGDAQGDLLLRELRDLPEEERDVPAGEEQAVAGILAHCARKERVNLRTKAALRTFCKVAAVLLVLGSLAGYASFTASAGNERQDDAAQSGYSAPMSREEEEAPAPDPEMREDQR